MNIILAIAFVLVSVFVYQLTRQWAAKKQFLVPESFGYSGVVVVVVVLALVMALLKRCH